MILTKAGTSDTIKTDSNTTMAVRPAKYRQCEWSL